MIHGAIRPSGREGERTTEEAAGKTWMGVCSPMTLVSRGKCIEENESNCHVPTGQNQLINHTSEQNQ